MNIHIHPDDRDLIADRIREERRRLGYKEAAFANVFLGRKHFTLTKIECGMVPMDADDLRVAACVGMDVQYIITGIRTSDDCLAAIENAIGYATIGARVAAAMAPPGGEARHG